MAYPYQISTTAKLLSPMYNPGPHAAGDWRHVVLMDKANNHVEVWKSTDLGVTWAEADSANHKSVESTSQNIDTLVDGTDLYISYSISGTFEINIAKFDMLTGLWGAVITGGPLERRVRKLYLMSNGNFRLLFLELDGSSVQRVSVQTYSGTWSSTTVLFAPGTVDASGAYLLHSAILDSSDNLHILVTNQSLFQFRYRTYTSGDTLTDVIYPNQFSHASISPTAGNAIAFVSGNASLIAFPNPLTQLSGALDTVRVAAIICENANSPNSFAAHVVVDDLVADDGTNFENYTPSLVYLALTGSLYLYYSKMTTTPEFHVLRSCSNLGGWAAPTTLIGPITGSTNHIRYVAARAVTDAKIGFAFSHAWANTGGTYEFPWYYEETPACSAASACGGAAAAAVFY